MKEAGEARMTQIEKILAEPKLIAKVMAEANICKSVAREYIQRLRDEKRVYIFKWQGTSGSWAAVYCAGNEPDAERPRAAGRKKRIRIRNQPPLIGAIGPDPVHAAFWGMRLAG